MEGMKHTGESKLEKLSPAERFERLMETGAQINKAVWRTIPLAGLLLSAMPAVEKSTYGYEVTSETGQDGNRRWRHEDKETQEMIEYIAGVGKMPESYVLKSYRDTVFRTYLSPNIDTPPDGWEEFTRAQVEQYWISITSKEDLYNVPADFDVEDFVRETSERIFEKNLTPFKLALQSDLLYEKLWLLMEKCGNPKIRALQESGLGELENERRGPYDPLIHTMYLDLHDKQDTTRNFQAEMAHACQFHLKPFEAHFQKVSDGSSAFAHSVRNMMSFRDAYDEILYDKEGSLEHEAHKDIEPQIKTFIDDNRRVSVNFDF